MKFSVDFKIGSFLFFLMLFLYITGINGQDMLSDNEADYYVDKIGPGRVIATGLTGENNSADSDRLNFLIDSLSKSGGGIINIFKVLGQKYIYLRDVNLKDNIQIKIKADVILRPWVGGNNPPKNKIIFRLGKDFKVRNVAITNMDDSSNDTSAYFKVQLLGGFEGREKFVDIISASNFKIAGVRVFDSYTIFCNIECNLNKEQSRVEGDLPAQGVIKNIFSTNNHVGYGIVQIRAGKRILFKNLEGEGGVTLRIESGIPAGVLSKEATVDKIVGRNIINGFGKTAVLLSPHRIEQGLVDVRSITSINSLYAVEIQPGFLDKKGGVEFLGTFSADSYIGEFDKIVGGFGAQVKSKYFIFYPCEEQLRLRKLHPNAPDHESSIGYSLGIINYKSHPEYGCGVKFSSLKGCYTINVSLPDSHLVSGSFVSKDIINYADQKQYTDCLTSITSKKFQSSQDFLLYPNPATNMVNIRLPSHLIAEPIILYDLLGRKIVEIPKGTARFDCSKLSRGIYYIGGKNIPKQKLILQ